MSQQVTWLSTLATHQNNRQQANRNNNPLKSTITLGHETYGYSEVLNAHPTRTLGTAFI